MSAVAVSTELIQSMALWDLDAYGRPTLRSVWEGARDEAECAPSPAARSGWETVQDWQASHFDSLGGDSRRPKGATVTIPVRNGLHGDAWLVTLGVRAPHCQAAGLELWCQSGSAGEMLAWRRGWYTDAAGAMAAVSPHTRLPHRAGLPGLALELAAPAYLGNLGRSEFFVRAHHALESGLHHGLAIPASACAEVVVLLSSAELPLALRVELAVVEGDDIRSLGGHCQHQGDLFRQRPSRPWGSALLQDCVARGVPHLTTREQGADSAALLDSLDAQAVLAWPFQREGEPPMVLALWV